MMNEIEQKVRETIDSIITLYKDNPDRWKYEREVHYAFFELLFDKLKPEEIKNRFRWELSSGHPSYGKRENDSAWIDLVVFIDYSKFVAVEIELDSGAGIAFENELDKCIRKLKDTPICKDNMEKGFIVPLIRRFRRQAYKGITYEQLFEEQIYKAKQGIGGYPIEIIKDGIILPD